MELTMVKQQQQGKVKVFENEYYCIHKIPLNYMITYKVDSIKPGKKGKTKKLHSAPQYSFVDDGLELAKETAEYWMHTWMFEEQTGKPLTHAQRLQVLALSERRHDDCKNIKVVS